MPSFGPHLYSFCIVIRVNKQAAFILILFECGIEGGREGRGTPGDQVYSSAKNRWEENTRICCRNNGRDYYIRNMTLHFIFNGAKSQL